MGIIENEYKEDGELVMTEEEYMDLATQIIEASIYHDLGSGSNVDYIVINKNGHRIQRSYKSDNHKLFNHPDGYNFPKGTTEVLKTQKYHWILKRGRHPWSYNLIKVLKFNNFQAFYSSFQLFHI